MTHEKKYLAKSRATATANVHHMCNAHWVWRRPIPMLDGHAYAFKLAKQFAISRFAVCCLPFDLLWQLFICNPLMTTNHDNAQGTMSRPRATCFENYSI